MLEIITLNESDLLASGRHREVYRHPTQPNWLIKVINPTFLTEYYQDKYWFSRYHRERHYLVYVRELKEHLAARVFEQPGLEHIQNIVGIVDTNLGVGQVVQAVYGADGDLAPTLHTLRKTDRFDAKAEKALNEFLDWYADSEIIISDMRPKNLVLSSEGLFVAIDGLGNKNTIPLRHIRWLNRYKTRRQVVRFRQKIRLN